MENKVLDERQLLAVQLLAKGIGISQTARTVGVDRMTIYRWLSKQEFKKQKRELEKELTNDFRAGAKLELAEILAHGKNNEKLRAIELIFKLTGELEEKEEVPEMTIEEMLQSLGV